MKKAVHPKLSEQSHKILKERAEKEHRGLQNLCEYLLEGEAVRYQLTGKKVERDMKKQK